MAKRRISELFDEEAIKRQINELKAESFKFVDDLEAKLKGMAGNRVQIGNASNFKELNTAQQQYNSYIKDTDRLKKQLLDSEKKLHEAESTYTKIITANRIELQKKNAELKNQAQYEAATTGSIEKARAAVALLNKERNQLNLYTEEGRAKQEQLNAQINKYNDFIKNNVDLLSQQKINIGNYAGSLAKPFETLITKLEQIKANLKNGIGIGGGTDAESIKSAEKAVSSIQITLAKAGASNANSVSQTRALSNAYRDLTITLGKSGSETTFLSTLKAEVGEAKDQVADLNDELKLAASDTQGLDNVVGSLNALAGIAQGAAGAYALLGANEEDAAKVTANLIAIQGIANSVQQVGQELTKKGTTANKIYEFSQKQLALAFDTTAAAGTRFKAALITLGIGALIVGIGLLIANFDKIKAAISGVSKEQQILNDLNDKAIDNYIQEKTEVGLLVNEYQAVGTSQGRKKDIQKQLQEDYPAYFGNMKTEKEFAEGLSVAYEKLSRALLLKARVQAATSLISDNESKALKVELEAAQNQTNTKSAKFVGGLFNTTPDDVLQKYKDKKQREAKAYRDANKFLIDTILKSQQELDSLGGDPGKKAEKTTPDAKPQKITDNTDEELLKASFEKRRILVQRDLDLNKEIIENEKNTFRQRFEAAKEYYADNIILQGINIQEEIANEENRLRKVTDALKEQGKQKGADRQAINKQIAKEEYLSAQNQINITLRGQDRITKATQDFNNELNRLKEERKKFNDDEVNSQREKVAAILNILEEERQKVIARLKKKIDDEKAAADQIKAYAIKAAEETQATILFFLTASIDKEVAALDTRKRILDEQTARRINQINLLGLTEQERVKRTAEVEKQAMFETEQIEKRKRKLAVERAKYEKAANIASIISSTAQAVVSALGQKPWTPLNIALAVLVGGLGALQLARAVAAPLPAYRKGTDNAQKGLALVSEEGSELMERNGKMYLTPAQPTLMELAGGEKITPAHLTRDILNSIMFSKNMQSNGLILLQPSGMSKEQADKMISKMDDIKNETARNRLIINWHSDNGWNAYIQKNIR